MYMYVYNYVSVSVSVSVFVSVSVSVSVPVPVWWCVYYIHITCILYIYIHIYIYMFICIYIYIHIRYYSSTYEVGTVFDQHSIMKGGNPWNQGKLSWRNNHIVSLWMHAPTWNQALHPLRLSKTVQFRTMQQRTKSTGGESICKQKMNKMRMHTHNRHISIISLHLVVSRYI